jgi:Holliday junction resolvase RusA-like endonuclease
MANDGITFTVYGNPKPLSRQRFGLNRKTGKIINFNPSQTDKNSFLSQICSMKPDKPWEGPIEINVTFKFIRPKNHYTKKGLRPNVPFCVEKRPDLDNLVKLITDAMNGVFYRDDAQIVAIMASKEFGDQPCTVVNIKKLAESVSPGAAVDRASQKDE